MESVTITQVNIHELKALIEGAVRDALKSKGKEPSEYAGGDLLTVPQAASLLHLSVPTIYGLIHRRELPSLKRGKRVYFKRSELLLYLEQGRRSTLSEIATKPILKSRSRSKNPKR